MTLLSDLNQVSATSQDLAAVASDWTGRVRGTALAVAAPASTAELAAVLSVCARHGVGVTVRGGGTGLVAGAVPQQTVVVSTHRLDRLGPVQDGTLLVGAGVTLAAVGQQARRAGWDYGVDFASRDSATIGGTVATNAGGVHVLAHGTTRAQVLGVEAVLADSSTISRLGGLAKDATGYDLGQLLVGSEGTLAVVTAVRLRLVPRARAIETALVACASVQHAVELTGQVRARAVGLRAAELILDEGLRLVRQVAGLPAPLAISAAAYVLLEAEANLAEAVSGAHGVLDAAVAADAADAARLWAYRERITEAVATLGTPHKLDVCLPRGRLSEFLDRLPAVVAPHQSHVWGHVGDGNLHVNILGPGDDDEQVDEAVLALAADLDGSIGAEHGIGRLKRRWLHFSRTDSELAAMRAIKNAWDPTGLLNPGVLLP